jgi:hypothetical protein
LILFLKFWAKFLDGFTAERLIVVLGETGWVLRTDFIGLFNRLRNNVWAAQPEKAGSIGRRHAVKIDWKIGVFSNFHTVSVRFRNTRPNVFPICSEVRYPSWVGIMTMYDMKWSAPRKLGVNQSKYYDYYVDEPEMRSIHYCFQYFRLTV